MRIAALSPALIGKKIAKTVYASDGRPLLRGGFVLTQVHLDTLARRGFNYIYIENELIPGLKAVEAVTEDTHVSGLRILREIFTLLTRGKHLQTGPLLGLIDEILSDLRGNSGKMFTLPALGSLDDRFYHHTLNVAILTLALGRALNYSGRDLVKLGLGAFLHDIGKLPLPQFKTGRDRHRREEREPIAEHPETGYRYLRNIYDISLLSAHMAFQHHEFLDGSGHPRGLTGDRIHEFGRIAAVANTYDNILMGGPAKSLPNPVETARRLRQMAGLQLDAELVDLLLRRMAVYPTGALVQLSTKEVAVVADQNTHAPERPRVLILTDSDFNLVEPRELDMEEVPEISVKGIMKDYPKQVKEHLAAQ